MKQIKEMFKNKKFYLYESMLRLAGTQMIILTQYHVVMKNGIYRVVSDKPSVCPSCQGALKVRDSKRRQVILADGQTHIFLLRRLKCKKCGALHLELPDLFVICKTEQQAREMADVLKSYANDISFLSSEGYGDGDRGHESEGRLRRLYFKYSGNAGV